jgi:hypothetical protein
VLANVPCVAPCLLRELSLYLCVTLAPAPNHFLALQHIDSVVPGSVVPGGTHSSRKSAVPEL